jgi:ribokinase
MLGQVGKDDLTADKYLTWMREQGVNTELIIKTDVPTGQAYIYHYPNGDNSIILVGGANKAYKQIPNSWIQAVCEADVLLCQREIPEWVNIHCGKHAKMLILDCGGSLEPISDELIDLCHIVSPNATERECLIGKFPKDLQIEYLERLVAVKSHL